MIVSQYSPSSSYSSSYSSSLLGPSSICSSSVSRIVIILCYAIEFGVFNSSSNYLNSICYSKQLTLACF